ncbi:MAG: hypothetical protein KAR06_05605 [Deltaproteobacteria bacterium]|nr:hypothetical protein [Deltaproteobacteria bacterium]
MDNLLHLTVTRCQLCGIEIKGDPGRTICNGCVCAAIKESRFRTREESRARVCAAIEKREKRELAEVISINR